MSKAQLSLDGSSDPERRMALGQFDTPPELAARQVAMIREGWSWFDSFGGPLRDGAHVLEPSAGCGALVLALLRAYPNTVIDAVELDPARVEVLREKSAELARAGKRGFRVHESDFLEWKGATYAYDLIVSNPPFTSGAEREHLAKMFALAPRVIVQLPIRALHGQARTRDLWSRVGKDFHLRAEVRVAERVYPNASDDIILCDFRREPGPCRVSWWSR